MIVTRNSHTNDVIELTRNEINAILNEGCSFTASGVEVRMIRKPDQIVYPATAGYRGENGYAQTVSTRDQLKLTFDGETGKLKKAEVL